MTSGNKIIESSILSTDYDEIDLEALDVFLIFFQNTLKS